MNFHRKTALFFILSAFSCFSAYSQAPLQLSNKNATKEARALYRYLQDMHGKKMLAGQMVLFNRTEELDYIQAVTGKLPAIRGMDFIDSSRNENEV
ncbi:MAG: glycosyl hydrolase, partial [Sphingobacteriales bacterium]